MLMEDEGCGLQEMDNRDAYMINCYCSECSMYYFSLFNLKKSVNEKTQRAKY